MTNVPSYRQVKDFVVEVPGIGQVRGDVAFGGNWFFLVEEHGLVIDLWNHERLNSYCSHVRDAVNAKGFPQVDHVELFGPAREPGAHSRNYVLCPGKAYDRSPCGTGTSAKLACLYADGKLREGQLWRQESIVGSVFEGTVRIEGGRIIPRITGSAHVCAEATLILDPNDPFQTGIRE